MPLDYRYYNTEAYKSISQYGGDSEAWKELNRAMKELPFGIMRFVTGPGCRAGALVIRKRLKATVPVRSGALRKSVRMRTINDYLGKIKIPGGAAIVVMGGKGARHAHLIESGTVNQRPTHVMRRAAEDTASEQHTAFVQASQKSFVQTIEALEKGVINSKGLRSVINQL